MNRGRPPRTRGTDLDRPDDSDLRPIRCLRENVDLDLLLDLRAQWVAHRDTIEEHADAFALLGNTTRLSILWLIERSPRRELCPCDLADVIGVTVPAVSQQLQRLRRGKLVRNRREGKTIFYSLTALGRAALEPTLQKEGDSHGRRKP